jgi:hypothetical protein
MPRHDIPLDYESQQPVALSPRRPPQFNESNCGYRCGLGGCEPRDGDDDDSAPTLVGSEDEDEAYAEIPYQEVDDYHQERVNEAHEVGPDPIVMMDDFEESLYLSQSVIDQQNSFTQPQLSQTNDESPGSLENQANSEPPSSAASEVGPIDIVPLPGWDAGIGREFDNELTHHFLVRPLRLSPQYEHCRGPPASHLVIQDYSMLLDVVGDDWRVWMPGNSSALYHNVEYSRR